MRVLATFAFSFSAAIFAAVYCLPFGWTPYLSLVLLVIGLLLFFTKQRWTHLFVLMLLGAAVGLGWFYVHDLRTLVPARMLEGSQRRFEATVLEYPSVYERYCRVTVRIENEDLPHLNALLYDGFLSTANMEPGDRIEFEARLSAATKRYNEETDDYTAKDIYLKLNAVSITEVIIPASRFDRLALRIQHALIRHIEQIFPCESTAFMKALLLGEKSDLYDREEDYLHLSRAGNMHALAVSGLHISFLVGMIQLILGKQRLSSLVSIALVWAFVLITGASPSALRAAVMQTLLLLAPLLRRENDPPTALAFALGVILMRNPRAAASVSLQLSFAAMAGILCFGSSLHQWFLSLVPKGKLRKLFSAIAAAAASSLAVLPFTVPLMAIHFGYVSLISPISGVLCFFAISMCFCIGYLACLFSVLFAPLGMLLARAAALFAGYVLWVSGILSSIPHAVDYLESGWLVPWLVGTYLLFIAAHFLPLRKSEKLLIPLVLAVLSMLLLSNIVRNHFEKDGYFSAIDVGQGQCLCVFDGPSTVLIDCGNHMTLSNAGDLAGRFLISRGRSSVDTLILTHMDTDHINGVSMLMEMLPVKRIVLPAGMEDESGLVDDILTKARNKNAQVDWLEDDSVLQLEKASLCIYAPLSLGSGNDSGLFVQVDYGGYGVLVTGDASQKTERQFLMHALPDNMNLLVVGHHGSSYASSDELLRLIGADTAIISVGYNTYGHPAEETLERLALNHYNVFRTDLDGSITIHIEGGHGEKES